MAPIKVQSNDMEQFEIDMEVVKQWGSVKEMLDLEKNGKFTGVGEETIPLLNINAATLRRVLEWCEQHRDGAPSGGDDEDKPIVFTEWEAKFLNVDHRILCQLCNAANYMDIQSLLRATCNALANMMKGKTTEEIRKHFNIKNDLTPEEQEKVEKERDLFNAS